MKSSALLRGFSSSARLYLRPVGLYPTTIAPPQAMKIAGGNLAFTALELAVREAGHVHRTTAAIVDVLDLARTQGRSEEAERLLHNISAPRASVAGLDFSEPRIMGILNVTPDSFHDGGMDADADAAIQRGKMLAQAGAHIVDVGGESTRPGAQPVADEEELRRVLPIVEGLAGSTVVSIDSRRAGVLSSCLAAGAGLANDVHALTGQGCEAAVARRGAPVVLMHGPADPSVMRSDTDYVDVSTDVWDWLEARIRACEEAGIPRDRIMVDPGIGFSKTARQSARVLADIALFHSLGCAIVLGASRKSFIAGVSSGEASEDRLPGSVVAAYHALNQGVQVLRVHDVAETAQAVAVWQSIAV